MRIVECVPNISEGRDRIVIDAIAGEVTRVPGIALLDVDPGEDTNRTVITFVGEPEAVGEAAFRLIRKAAELIDMSRHHGAHPRMGATDVCPFVPVAGVTMDDCVALAHKVGRRVGEELGIPVYLYEYAATRPERKNLAECRKGEYEGLPSRVGDPYWTPDYGPDVFNPRAGAIAVGARDFLIAWNINLNTRDVKIATRIANRLREKGYRRTDASGKPVRNRDGEYEMEPGLFKAVKAVGWYIEEYRQTQISINLTNYKVSPLQEVFDAACRLADEYGVRVTGSELVGLIPLEAMLQAGRHYLRKAGSITGADEAELVRTAVLSLGLSQLRPFNPDEKIIEYRIRKAGRLASMTLAQFADELASESPAPGGGSVAALCGALAAALASMVAHLTFGRKGFAAYNAEMDELSVRAQDLKARLLALVDEDTEAFNQVMAAMKMPKGTPELEAERDRAMGEATRRAAEVPFRVLTLMPAVAELADAAAVHGNPNLTPDAGVAALCAALAARGAAYNVRVNLKNLPPDDFADRLCTETDRLLKLVEERVSEIRQTVENRLWS